MSRLNFSHVARVSLAISCVSACFIAEAALTDLSNLPLSSSSNLQVKPNVMFILDDSATMGREYMPDGVGDKKDTVGFRNSSCNLVYYNPATNYVIPMSSLGGPINPATASDDWGSGPSAYTAALDDGFYYFDGGTRTEVNLSSAFKSHYLDGAQPAYYWNYLGSGSLTPLNADCNTALLSASDTTTVEICSDRTTKVSTGPNCAAQGKTALWRKVLLSTATTDEQLNFANWYSYYRTRLNMMKSASGRAIVPLSDSYRVGFLTIDPGIPVLASKFLPVGDFNATNKASWFKKLYSQKVNDKTPLRTALSRAGRYYAGKMDGINEGITDDPVQFSCQQNFTILTTDGYWNTTGGYDIVGNPLTTNQDGSLTELDAYNLTANKFLVSPRPIYDGSIRFNWKTAAIEYRDNTSCTFPQRQQQNTQWQTQTIQWQKTTVQNQQSTTQLQTRTTQLQKTFTRLQQRTAQWQQKTVQLEKQTTQLQRQRLQQQKTYTQLKKRTQQIKKQVVQYQSKITQLQKQVLQLQKRTARFRACSGLSGTGSCVDLSFDCTSSTGDGAKPYCYITGDTGWNNATSCTPAYTETSSTVCRTTDTGWVNSGSCTTATGSTAVNCQTVTTQDWTNSALGSCSNLSINASGVTYSCRALSDTGAQNAGSCAASDPAGGPTTTCPSTDTTVNAGSCTDHGLDANGETVICSTTAAATIDVASCTVASINASGETITACPTRTVSSWANSGTCAAGTNASGVITQCQTINLTWSNVGSCTSATINSSGVTVNCRSTTISDWADVASCTPSAPASGPTVLCQTTSDTGWLNVAACTPSAANVMPTVTCQTTAAATANVGTCATGFNNITGENIISCTTTNPSWSPTGVCNDTPFDSATGQDVQCNTTVATSSNIGTCPSGPFPKAIDSNGVTVVSCGPVGSPSVVDVAACSESNPAAGPTVTCQKRTDTGWVNTGKCTASAANVMPTVTCNSSVVQSWFDVATCTDDSAAQPSIECRTVDRLGHQLQYRTQITNRIYRGSNQTDTLYSTTPEAQSGWVDAGTCSATAPTVPAAGPAPAAGPPALPTGCTAWPCELPVDGYGSNTSLADVAQYYYKTDLRDTTWGNCGSPSVCDNNVKTKGTGPEDDKASWQHMTTFTLGLGVSGSLTYKADYKTSSSGDFVGLRDGTKDWPVPVVDVANADGELVNPSYAIDDLWHAAVDGRGQYFGADTPANVVSGLGKALNDIESRSASGSGAAVSNQQLLATGNLAFVTTYLTKKWTGNLQALKINAQTGVLEGSPVWDAQAKLDLATKDACDNRTIKLFRQGATNNLVDFAQNTYACDLSGNPTGSPKSTLNASELAFFDANDVATLSQFPLMTSSQRTAAEGAKMVNYLRGQRGNETFVAGDDDKLFRARDHVLGDIVYAGPRYVQAPFAGYDDKGYESFKTSNASRTPMIYVGANDGMVHAFNAENSASGGVETWAFVPSTSLTNLHKIASENYGNEHVFSVDGTPTSNDVCASDCSTNAAVWKTILVGGLRAGGRGYYALDITDPATPKALWEFKASNTCFDAADATPQYTDCHIGFTYGAPVIAKLHDGRWVVFVSSGYNNVNVPAVAGDGQGYLYVLEAMTGKIIYKIGTGVGSETNPSGLSGINARSTETLRDNTADYVYGTDLLGNVWRFDINDLNLPTGVEAGLVAQVVDSTGTPQPITTTPLLGIVNGEPYVYVATGRYLGASDLLPPVSTQTQSIWAIKDPVKDTPVDEEVPTVTNLRATLKTITTTTVGSETSTTAYRTNSCTAQCASTAGWYTDLPVSGERVNIDMKLDLGTLLAASNVPPASACEIAGTSWVNFFDASSGLHVANSTNMSTGSRVLDGAGKLTQVVGLNIIRTTTGQVIVQATTGDGGVSNPYVAFSSPLPTGRRVSWREIVQ